MFAPEPEACSTFTPLISKSIFKPSSLSPTAITRQTDRYDTVQDSEVYMAADSPTWATCAPTRAQLRVDRRSCTIKYYLPLNILFARPYEEQGGWKAVFAVCFCLDRLAFTRKRTLIYV